MRWSYWKYTGVSLQKIVPTWDVDLGSGDLTTTGDLFGKDLTLTGSSELGNANTDIHGINTTPVAGQMLTADYFNDANPTSYFIDGTYQHAGDDAKTVRGYYLNLDISGTLDIANSSVSYGIDIDLDDSTIYNGAAAIGTHYGIRTNVNAGTNTNSVVLSYYGGYFSSNGDIGTTGTTSHYGLRSLVTGTADTNYGIYLDSSGATTNWALYNAGGNMFMGDDDVQTCWGTAGATDSYIRFGGTNLEYYSSGAHDFGAGDIDTTGDITTTGSGLVGDSTNPGISGHLRAEKMDIQYKDTTIVPLVTFIFDDGWETDYTVMKPVFDAQGEVACSAIITTKPGTGSYMTWNQIEELQAAGWEILGHTKTHVDLTTSSDAELIDELGGAKEDLEARGFIIKNFVNPYHATNENVRSFIKRYYRGARSRFIADDHGINEPIIHTYKLFTASGTTLTEEEMKDYIDEAEAENGWILFMLHQTDATLATKVGNVIDYIQGKGISIVTMDQALDLKENVFEMGDTPEGRSFAVNQAGFVRANFYDLNVEMRSKDERGLNIDGYTNEWDKTGSGWYSFIRLRRDHNAGDGNEPANLYGMNLTLTPEHTLADITDNNKGYYGLSSEINDTADWTTSSDIANRTVTQSVLRGKVNNDGTYGSTGTSYIESYLKAGDFYIDADPTFTATGGATNILTVKGIVVDVNSNPTLSSGNLTVENFGIYVDVSGDAVGDSTNYGIYIAGSSGADTNYGIYDTSGADWILDSDSQKITFGEDQDYDIEWNGSDAVHTISAGNFVFTGGVVDIYDGTVGLIVGADWNATHIRTNLTKKDGRMGVSHYTIAEEPVALLLATADETVNRVNIGGGSSLLNTATEILFYTAANTTTVSGTERMKIDTNGNLFLATGDMSIGTTIQTSDLTIIKSSADPVGIVVQNKISDGDTHLDLLEGTSGTGEFGVANNFGFRFTYDGGLNDFFFQSGNGATVKTIFSVNRDAAEIVLYDKLIFTQTDGNEAIDSLNDGYMDYLATTGHRFNNDITTTGRMILDGDSSMADYANSAHAIIFGDGQDSAIGYDSQDTYLVNLVGAGDFRISMDVDILGGTWWTGEATGLSFGGISVYNNGTADTVATATWTQLTRFDTNDPSNNTTPDNTNDHITITKAGKYLVTMSCAFSGDPNVTWTGGVWKNNGGTQITNLQAHRKLGAGGDVGSVSAIGIADFALNDTIEIWFEHNEGVNKNITVVDCTLSIVQTGGT